MNEAEAAEPGERSIGGRTAMLLVVASMVGTGVFTTTGHLLSDVSTPLSVVVCWGLGGLLALFGALGYGELAVRYPESGGETTLTTHIYGPRVGFVAGFISIVVGFSAPIAASAIAFGEYAGRALGGTDARPVVLGLGIGLIVAMTILHGRGRRGAVFQNSFTLLKVVLILAITGIALAAGDFGRLTIRSDEVGADLLSRPFAVGLVYVSFAYAGWNAAVYVAGEVRDPSRQLPRSLSLGTALVTLLYLGLNVAFLVAAPPEDLAGETEVAHVAAAALFGEHAARVVSAVIALGLLSTVGAMVLTGARVAEAMGRRHAHLAFLARRDAEGRSPVVATITIGVLSVVMALSASFDALLIYAGVTLSFFAALTVFGVFIVRHREPHRTPPRVNPLHPFSTVAFIGLSGWMIAASIIDRPWAALSGVGTLVLGFLLSFALSSKADAR